MNYDLEERTAKQITARQQVQVQRKISRIKFISAKKKFKRQNIG